MEADKNIENKAPENTIPEMTEMTAEEVVVTEEKPVMNEAPKKAPKDDIVFNDKPKKKTGMILCMILLLLIAAGGVGFGVWAQMDGNSHRDNLNAQINSLKEQNSKLLEQLGEDVDEIVDGETEINPGTSSSVKTEDYIYVGEWGVKFKIPENLQHVSYTVNDFDYDGGWAGVSLCVSGATTGHGDKRPSFLGKQHDIVSLGCLSKNTKSSKEGYYGAGSDNPVGEYYYLGPQAVIDDMNVDWEIESVNTIKEMLSTSNMSAI